MTNKYPISLSLFTALTAAALVAESACTAPPQRLAFHANGTDAASGDDKTDTDSGDSTAADKVDTNSGTTVGTTNPGDTATTDGNSTTTTMTTETKLPCTDESEACHPHRFIVADEPLRKIAYVNLDDPSKDWDLNVPKGARDLQLVGNNQVLVGTLEDGGGYHIVDITTGKIMQSVLDFGGTVGAVQRLKNGHTLVMGEGLQGGKGTVILEVDDNKKVYNKIEFANLHGGRMYRRTAAGTYLIGTSQDGMANKDAMVEMSADGKELARYQVNNWPAHYATRLANGNTIVASGHGMTELVFDKSNKLIQTIGGKDQDGKDPVHPNYAGHFQVLNNGHIVTTNWQGHENNLGNSGRQLIEYDAQGVQVWTYKQSAPRFSGIHGVLVLDNLDTSKVCDDAKGALAPAE